MMRVMGIVLGCAMLAACGSSDDEQTFTTADGEEVTVSSGESGSVDLPQGFSLYPGATVINNTTVNTPDGGGTIVMFQSDASPEDLVGHYRREAEAAGVEIAGEMTSNGVHMIGGEGANGLAFSFTATPGDDGTMGQLSVGRGAPQ